MTLGDRLPSLDDASLLNLKNNAARLSSGPEGAQQSAAAALLPLVEAEIAVRAAAKKPVKAAPRASRKKAAA